MMKRNGDSVMEKVYLLLEKNLGSERIVVAGVFASRAAAEESMEHYLDFNEEECAYKIEEKRVG